MKRTVLALTVPLLAAQIPAVHPVTNLQNESIAPSTTARISALERAAAAEPGSTRRKLALAFAYLQRVRETADYSLLEKAEALDNQALAADGGSFEATRLRNEIALQRHEFRQVALTASDLAQLNGSDAGNWGNLGDALMELGEYQKAEQAYGRMVLLKPGVESYNRAAYAQFVTGHPAEAISLMRLAIGSASAISPEPLAWCHAELGDMLFKTGALSDARAEYAEAVRLFPALHRAHAGLGRIFSSAGKKTQAVDEYLRAQSAVPLVEYSAALADLYEQLGRRGEAGKQRALVDVVDQLAAARGEKANRTLALIYADENRKQDRALALAEAELENRGDVYTYDALSWVYFKLSRLPDASQASAKAIAYSTPEPIFYYHAGCIAAAAGRSSEARKYLERALALNPGFDDRKARDAKGLLAKLPLSAN